MPNEKDIYDLEVERLTKEPELIDAAWFHETPLFKMIGDVYDGCGCLTQIKGGYGYTANVGGFINEALQDAIENDEMIPGSAIDITPAHLPHFAKWQRRIDRMNAGESFEEAMKDSQGNRNI